MLDLAADENFNRRVLRGLQQRAPDLDVVRIQDVGLRTLDDPTILTWCADNGRVLLTHDRRTMERHAYERVRAGLPMTGVMIVNDRSPPGPMIGAILREALVKDPAEYADKVIHIRK